MIATASVMLVRRTLSKAFPASGEIAAIRD
jgi:hypothetical protein